VPKGDWGPLTGWVLGETVSGRLCARGGGRGANNVRRRDVRLAAARSRRRRPTWDCVWLAGHTLHWKRRTASPARQLATGRTNSCTLLHAQAADGRPLLTTRRLLRCGPSLAHWPAAGGRPRRLAGRPTLVDGRPPRYRLCLY